MVTPLPLQHSYSRHPPKHNIISLPSGPFISRYQGKAFRICGMGQRHNRRRTRPRSRNYSTANVDCFQVRFADSPPCAASRSKLFVPRPLHPTDFTARVSREPYQIPPAHIWHYWYLAWQKRERRLRLETAKLEAEQCRLFGGEPGDDMSLCYRMLEYFDGLDYIDP